MATEKQAENSSNGLVKEAEASVSNNRFYPNDLPPFKNEPSRDHFEIARVGDSVGEGVKTLVSFEEGDILFQFTGFFSSEITLFSLQVEDGLHLHDPYFMGKVLHSCQPNASVDMHNRTFTAVRHIDAGEFITMDYASTEEELYRTFECSCGAPNCRGMVKGTKQ
jgi:uncharacterized protein